MIQTLQNQKLRFTFQVIGSTSNYALVFRHPANISDDQKIAIKLMLERLAKIDAILVGASAQSFSMRTNTNGSTALMGFKCPIQLSTVDVGKLAAAVAMLQKYGPRSMRTGGSAYATILRFVLPTDSWNEQAVAAYIERSPAI